MNISFNPSDMKNTNAFVNVGQSAQGIASSSSKISNGLGISVNLNSSAIENNAYKGSNNKNKDIVNSADLEAMTLSAQRDYMTIMSNCVSDEDFAKMQKEGFNPGSTDVHESVSIVDKIKAEMIKGGTNVVGYTDTLSSEALENIAGSKVYANELKNQFEAKDIPLTEENASEVVDVYEKLSNVSEISDAGKKYLVENSLTPSVDNIYTATYSAGKDASVQGHGYYSAGNVSGYYAKKPDDVNIDELLPQIESIVKNAGYEFSKESIEASKWLIEKGIPLTEETFDRFMNINEVTLPMSFEEFTDHATDALSDGIQISKADLSRKTSLRQEATDIYNEVQSLGTIKGRRVLEEVRLQMTVEANLKLLRSGYAIDTAPMEELVKNLKEIEKEYAINLTGDDDEVEAIRKKNTFEDTVNVVEQIKVAPINISYAYEEADTLFTVGQKAVSLANEYERASESYETLMTTPRYDLGDRISKAFQNVDDMLSSMELPLTEENRRAVRILGYNRMEITEENIDAVSKKDSLLTETLENLTPGRVLGLIRSDNNPLMMSVSELNEYLKAQDTTKDDLMSYSKFLYKLEQSNEITENEREAYIGIYRLVNQIEKGDHSSVGVIEATNAQFNLENIISTIRSRKHKPMDYKVDSTFGGVELSWKGLEVSTDATDRGIASITTQIAKGQIKDVKDLKEMLEEIGDSEAKKEFEKEQFEQVREAFRTEEDILSMLNATNTPVNAENIASMELMLNNPSSVFKKLKEIGYKKDNNIKLDSKEEAQKSYEKMTDEMKEFIEEEAFGENEDLFRYKSVDIREMADMYQHINFLNYQSGDENFEIPADINGEITAINLKVIHGKEESSVAISFESEIFGKVASQFQVTDKGLSGYCSCSNKEGVSILDNNKDALKLELDNEDIMLDDVHFIEGKDIDLKEFQEKVIRDRKADTDVISTDKLYKAAKIFIGYVERAAKQ